MTATIRCGPFWDSVERRRPVPPAAATLGLGVVDADVEQGTIELAFEATEVVTTPRGDVLEGFLATMLHDTPCAGASTRPDQPLGRGAPSLRVRAA